MQRRYRNMDMSKVFVSVLVFVCFQSYDCLSENESKSANNFNMNLLAASIKNRAGNVVVSPASVIITLAMLIEATEGKTADEIKTAMGMRSNYEQFRERLKSLSSVIKATPPGVALKTTNLLLTSNKLKINEKTALLLRDFYSTYVQSVDFSNVDFVATALDKWASYSTNGLIESSIEPDAITPSTEMFLTNVLYYNNTWKDSFSTVNSNRECFYLRNQCTQVTMMELSKEIKYAFIGSIRVQALELPYQDGRFSMLILVPTDKDGIEDVVSNLPKINLKEIRDKLVPTDASLYMPKFVVNSKLDLVQPFYDMNIRTLFTTSGRITKIFDDNTSHINSMLHEIYLSVDEKGTVGAASTSAILVPLIGSKVQVVINRPFLFFILDTIEGIVLFEGKIEQPITAEQRIPDIVDDTSVPSDKEGVKTQKVAGERNVIDSGGWVVQDFKDKVNSTNDSDSSQVRDKNIKAQVVITNRNTQLNETQQTLSNGQQARPDVGSKPSASEPVQKETHWYDKIVDFFG